MKIAKLAAATVAALTLTGSAFAADLPSRKAPILAPPPPVFTWTGFYVGINAGGTVTNRNNFSTQSFSVVPETGVFIPQFQPTTLAVLNNFGALPRRSSAVLGGQAGYNWQFSSNFLLGFETDMQGIIGPASRASFFNVVPVPGVAVNTNGTGVVQKRLDYLGTVRARLGYLVTPTFLIYATGGLAYGGVKSNTAFVETTTPFASGATLLGGQGGLSTAKVGYTVGGGVEWMFMPSWSLKAEYLYYDLRTVTYNGGGVMALATAGGALGHINGVVSRTQFDGHLGRLGVNYHFWGPPAAPVVARY